MRTFIAIDIDPAIKATLADFIRRLRRINAKDVSWSGPESFHLTLKFLGELDEPKLEAVQEALAGRLAGAKAFPLVLKGTGYFPQSPRFIRVLWAGVYEQPSLMALQRDVEFAMTGLGFPPESPSFHPHLTLGRVRSPLRLRELLDELERYKHSDFGQMTASRVTLFQSQLRPSGAVYSSLREFPLA